MSFATASTDPSSSFTEDESLERNNNLVPGEHNGANQRQRKIVSSKKDHKRKNERANESSTFLEVDLGGYSADKENKREQVDTENDSLAVIAAKVARKLSPKSSSNQSFFQGWTAYDIYLYSRHRHLW
eukprot:CAMPEP_0116043016 /NCGR_PEP_ID=MMETSP0321-20121206/26081_1 /TAXON_ID=163516 /ORGANISM="Leptocylindrus danicus var. danicus, Strain B650" /LENGTH=127 /DNA_ID=CAMNT_0003523697 /DNA_START=1352 /DNA_END=1732 /DNA_ORIENTATION=+